MRLLAVIIRTFNRSVIGVSEVPTGGRVDSSTVQQDKLLCLWWSFFFQ